MRNQSERPLTIEVPSAEKDKPAWVKVGVIAAVGFVIGIAWPRLAGVHIGPNAPADTAAAASAAHAARAPDAPPASVSAKLAMPAPSGSAAAAPPSASAPAAPAAAAVPPVIVVAKGMVLTCVTSDGEKKKGRDCGGVPGVDEIVRPRLKKIASCSGVEGQTGKFSITANADFVSGRFYYDVNKVTATVQNLDAITACLKTSFHNTATTATPHEHAKYTVVYTANLSEPDKGVAHADKPEKDTAKAKTEPEETKPAPAADKPAAPAATGEAEVSWDVALVRDSPKTGGLVQRLPRGTKVKVGASKDGWYQVKFGDGFATEGWVYRGAIGR